MASEKEHRVDSQQESDRSRVCESKCTVSYYVAILCAAAYLLSISEAITFTIGTLFVDWTETFNSSTSQTAWVISLNFGVTYMTGPVSAALCAHFGNRATAMAGSLLASLGMAASSFCTDIIQMYITFGVLTGLGFGIMMTPSMNSICEHFTEHRSLAMGVASTVSGLCLFIFPYSFRAAADLLSWRGAHLVIASLIVQCCIMGALLRAPTEKTAYPEKARCDGQNRKHWWQMLTLLKDPRLVLFVIGNVFMTLGSNSLPVIIVDYAVDVGISKSGGAQILSFVGIGGLCGRILILPLLKIERFKGNTIYIFIGGGFLRSLGVALCASNSSFATLSVFCFTYGFGLGVQISSSAMAFAELFGPFNLEYYFGILYWSIGIGSMLGAPLTGWIYDAVNSYRLPLYLGGGVCLVASVFHILVARLPSPTATISIAEGGEIAIIYTNKLTERTKM